MAFLPLLTCVVQLEVPMLEIKLCEDPYMKIDFYFLFPLYLVGDLFFLLFSINFKANSLIL